MVSGGRWQCFCCAAAAAAAAYHPSILLIRIDRIKLTLEVRHVTPRLDIHRIMRGELDLQALVLVHKRRPDRL